MKLISKHNLIQQHQEMIEDVLKLLNLPINASRWFTGIDSFDKSIYEQKKIMNKITNKGYEVLSIEKDGGIYNVYLKFYHENIAHFIYDNPGYWVKVKN